MRQNENTDNFEKKAGQKGIVIGYDLCKQFAQISYCFLDDKNVETLSAFSGEEKFNIPLCLRKRDGVNQWYFGREALEAKDDGFFVTDLLAKVRKGDTIVVEDMEVNPVELLKLFIRKSFSLMGMIIGNSTIEAIVITIDTLDEQMLTILNKATQGLHVDSSKIHFVSHIECLHYYTIHQPKELWNYEVCIFDFSDMVLKSFLIEMNSKTKPIVTFINDAEYPHVYYRDEFVSDMEEDIYYSKLDFDFSEIARTLLEGRIVTSVFLIGSGFHGDWYEESLKVLCKNRRVFGGNNLYSKGACLCALEKVSPTEMSKSHIFLGKEKLKYNIGMQVVKRGEEQYFPLLDAGISWFDAEAEVEIMLEKTGEIPVVITPLDGKDIKTIMVKTREYKNRPPRTIKVTAFFYLKSENELVIRITDLGFGDFFKPESEVWEKIIEIC